MAQKAKTFEESVGRIEEILQQLESGDTALSESMKLYEEGMKLIRSCNEELENAELKVRMLAATPDGKPALVDFEKADGEDTQ